ncbi:MAG: DNA topoisomerase I [Candidatus Yonathbacteria bacterium RIFCSPHIGHO2_01_FULL_44_41]|uniref:DNA topoisomerase 1 n=1 Tax=Candidatus Yonathbacteria bacterium RIFCSPHIGHO2_02_FULL_44_14 TaxID=1802724 RepID=A0A1G2SAF3_9BACT|nr:MAG: DNA topoisomerase I [Candidatus Yonathbacteria bacterium RIFCSPHIGHO2_01_FULL_44_41]OHA81662.1 MAG: DNA topoisomerase I [Candidatus Yonathbacteria bacterium RIFCSPHIGHO2_02_FULL_44_14]OHA81843.1 MAG: DNA topoisomerase I [Candidatus Yonathbacteria bacterium RIFCSPLOWO2_01_FULL_43_20]
MATKSYKLLIVESPSKAKTIGKYLGDDYIVKASVGHVRDLPKSNKQAIDIPGGFIPFYEISKGKADIVHEIDSLAKKASEVLLATDPDREGEAIAWHIAQACGLKNPKRVTYHEITKSAIEEAIAHPRKIDENLRKAQEARRVLDRLVGYDLSGLIWKKVRYGLSAGRVQSPALRIIMEREREIRAFIPEAYWTLTAKVKTTKGAELELSCTDEPRDENVVKDILKIGRANQWVVREVKESEVGRSPKAPFITSTLQQASSSRFGFAPSRTMGIAQKLYEKGFITYMRTDSTTLSKDATTAILAEIAKRYGASSVEARVYKTKSKNAQEAHEAIRPTDMSKDNLGINPEEKKLYKLIWARTIASQMVDARLARTTILANVRDFSIPNFSVTGSRVITPGWLAADPDSRGEDVELPKVAEGESLILLSLDDEAKFTEPPSRYSEAGLVKELEKRDIGRPSTYASIIKTICDRGYVIKDGKTLKPTDTGDVVSSFLEEHFANYISDTFTAEMENKLDDIANGEREYVKTLKDFYGPFTKDLKAKDKIEKQTNMGDADPKHKCPKCNGPMIIKLARNGKFLSCKKYPDCEGARMIDGTELAGPRDTGELCPKCGKSNLFERDGRFGRFIACGNYPKCKHIKKDETAALLNHTGVPCPMCKKGFMTERKGRFGIFYSCTGYPDCKNAIKARPTGRICEYPKIDGSPCDSLMMDGTKTIPERCSNKTCPNHNPHKLTK